MTKSEKIEKGKKVRRVIEFKRMKKGEKKWKNVEKKKEKMLKK